MQFPGTDSPATFPLPPGRGVAKNGILAIMTTLAFCFALAGEAAALVIDTVSPLPSATTTFPYNQTLTASGGTTPYIWSVVSGALPPGITLLQTTQTTADLTGTPTSPGNFTFIVQVTDSSPTAPATATMPYALTVVPYGPTAGIRYDISGSVSYSGTKTGRIYLTTYPSDNGVSIDAPGPFTIRGVAGSATMLTAWIDAQGTGNRHATDPFGSTTLTLPNTVSGITIAISDPTPQPASPPPNITVSPGDSVVFAQWDKGTKNGGVEYADSYSIYWSTSQAVSPTNTTGGGKRQNIPADDSNNVAITGLANGTPLYFVMTATMGGVESAPSPPIGPVTPGSLAGGATVSGTVTISGVTPSGPLYVAVIDKGGKGSNAYFTSIVTPGSSAPFTVSGVPDGSYRVYAAIDMNNDGIMGNLGDVTLSDQSAPYITVAGAPVAGLSLNLVAANAVSLLQTEHWRNTSLAGEGYSLMFEVRKAVKQPVNVTVTSGPVVSSPIDLGRFDSGEIHTWIDTVGVRPAVGDIYPLALTYGDGTTETVSVAVNGVSDNFPTAAAPLGNQTLVPNPVFSWSPATGAVTYELWVNGNNLHWDTWDIPAAQTSITYNFDGRGNPSTFINPGTYFWSIAAIDANRNRATDETSFNAVAATDTIPPVISAFALPALSSSLTVPVTFTASDNLTSVAYIVTETATTPNLADPRWRPAPPVTYTFASPGIRTLYAWVRDGSGNFSSPASASVTIDTTPPSVVSTSPANGATLSAGTPPFTVTFSEAIAPATLTPATILLTTNGVAQGVTVNAYDPATFTVSFTPAAAPAPGGNNLVKLTTGITDVAGNPLSATYSWSFTTVAGGDLDGDGVITVSDAVMALRMAVGAITPTASDLLHGDVAPLVGGVPAPDGKIDIGDAVVILRRVVGLVMW